MMNKFIYKFLKGLVTSMFSGIEGSLSQTYSGVCRILTISRFPQSEISNTEKWVVSLSVPRILLSLVPKLHEAH